MTPDQCVETAARAVLRRRDLEQEIRSLNQLRDGAYAELVNVHKMSAVDVAARVRGLAEQMGMVDLRGRGVTHDRVTAAAKNAAR